MNLMATLTWCGLLGLAAVVAHAVLDRILFHAVRREIDDEYLGELKVYKRRGCSSSFAPKTKPSGWLEPLVRQAEGSLRVLRQLCAEERRQMQRFDSLLPTAANVATTLGLLGSVLAVLQSSTEGLNPDVLLGLGLGTTVLGLSVASVGWFCYGLLFGRTERLVEQAREVIDVLDVLLAE